MSSKKELVEELAGALVAIFVGCIILIVIIVNIPGTKEIDGALIANVFTGGVTLFAPIAAYYLLNNWKDQKRYDLGHKYADKSLVVLNTMYKELNSRYAHFNIEGLLQKNLLVAVNRVQKYQYDPTSDLYNLIANVNILQSLFPKSLTESDFDNLETTVLALSSVLGQIENKYLKYYQLLPQKIKDFDYTVTLAKNNSIENLAFINAQENFFLKSLNKKFNIEISVIKDHCLVDSNHELTLNECFDNFKKEFFIYQDKMINIIKI